MIIILPIIVIIGLIITESILAKKNDSGGVRGYQLPEHARFKKLDISLNESYPFWNCVKDSSMVQKKSVRFEIDKDGYIAPSGIYSDVDQRIFFVGDSTVECALVDAEKRYSFLVGEQLSSITNKKINTYNMGYSGLDTMGALRLILMKAIPMHADVVIFSNAISELTSTLDGRESEVHNIDGFCKNTSIIMRLKSVLFALFPCTYLKLGGIKTHYDMQSKTDKCLCSVDEENAFEKMRQKYLSVINLCKANNVKLYLCTQSSGFISNPNDIRMKSLYDEFVQTDIEYESFARMLSKTNQLIRLLAKENDIGLLDLEKNIPYNTDNIYDYIHYTDRGSVAVTDYIVNAIKDMYMV